MKIKHYPGKAVLNDPAWLEMDIPNTTRGKLYEANWEDTQKSLSNSSSASNSWDKYSQNGTISSRLGQYQNMLDEIKKDNEDIYALPLKGKTGKDSMRLQYHSDKCLSRINSKGKSDLAEQYFLPSQNKKDTSTVSETKNPPMPKPRKKLPSGLQTKEKFNVVISDLQKHIKKSVRFDEVETEITNGREFEEEEVEDSHQVMRITSNPLVEELEDFENFDEEHQDGEVKERISTWIDDQNRYILASDQDDDDEDGAVDTPTPTCLKRVDSGYYEHSGKPRQRLPPKNIYPSCSSSSSSSFVDQFSYAKTSSSFDSESDHDETYSLYKNGSSPVHRTKSKVSSQKNVSVRTKNSSPVSRRGCDTNNDFLIPRPKLIVPVHTYAVRKRRTGNVLSSECGSVKDFNEDNDITRGLSRCIFLLLAIIFFVSIRKFMFL